MIQVCTMFGQPPYSPSIMPLTFYLSPVIDFPFRNRYWSHFGEYGREMEINLGLIVVAEYLID